MVCSYSHKIAYETREAAVVGLREQARRYGADFSIYACRDCGAWHLTTKHHDWSLLERSHAVVSQPVPPAGRGWTNVPVVLGAKAP